MTTSNEETALDHIQILMIDSDGNMNKNSVVGITSGDPNTTEVNNALLLRSYYSDMKSMLLPGDNVNCEIHMNTLYLRNYDGLRKSLKTLCYFQYLWGEQIGSH